MITQYSNFKYGTTQVLKLYQGTTLVWPPSTPTPFPIPEAVDLGLSVKWASFNLGAENVNDYGYRYAWGELEPKSTYDWSNYKWCQGTDTTLTRYNNDSNYGTVDNRKKLLTVDDAARVKLGGTWRIPTETEWLELRDNCTWTWMYGTTWRSGMLVTSNKPGYTNNSIFLPASMEQYGSIGASKIDALWASTLPVNAGGTVIHPNKASAMEYRYFLNSAYSDGTYVTGKAIYEYDRAKGFYHNYQTPCGLGIRPVCT